MARYSIDSLAALARQLAYAPADVRATQVDAAERLLLELVPDKTYPADYVHFRVTGHAPLHADPDLWAGAALQHDLGLLVEQASDSLGLHVDLAAEPVLAIDDVTARFNVTSKTIQRWRRKGLASRRFTFPDGKRRVGFLLSSIERFVARHADAVAHGGANPSLVSDAERDALVRHARRLATRCGCDVGAITRRLARRFRRSPLTVLHTIRRHDQQRPDEAVFADAVEPLPEARRAKLARAIRRGASIKALAEAVGRPRASVYRAVLDDRIERLGRRRVTFHDDPIYHGPDAEAQLAAMADSGELSGRAAEPARVPKGLPPYLADLYRTPLLTPAHERALFLQFNFYKGQFVHARRRFDPELARKRDLDALDACSRLASAVKNRIVQANLRLVVSVARKHCRPAGGLSLMELVSEGNLILMRAAESFDVHKNVRFSTYATLALMKGFARASGEDRGRQRRAGRLDAAIDVADPRGDDPAAVVGRMADRDELHRLLGLLGPHERQVIAMHYGLADDALTLGRLGEQLGLSRHRVRQIERQAMAKLRSAACQP